MSFVRWPFGVSFTQLFFEVFADDDAGVIKFSSISSEKPVDKGKRSSARSPNHDACISSTSVWNSTKII